MPNARFQDPLASVNTGGGTLDPLSQQLLNAALRHGGSVAQSAAEVTHPNSGFLSMAQDALGNAFHGVMDTLALPEDAITALLSHAGSNPLSFEQVRSQRISPSDVLFGSQPNPNASTMQKVGETGVRFLTDVLLDPLTYVTFGAGSGVKALFGVSRITRIPIKASTAKELGFLEKDLVEVAGGGKETVRHQALSREGLEALDTQKKRIEDQIKQDTVEAWNNAGVAPVLPQPVSEAQRVAQEGLTSYSKSNLNARISSSLKTFGGLSETDMNKMIAQRLGAENIAARRMRDLLKENNLIGKPVDVMTDAERDVWRNSINLATKEGLDFQAERLIRHTLDAKRGDIEREAAEQLSELIESNVKRGGIVTDKLGRPVVDQFGNNMVRNLAHSYLDKGGIKMFGQAVVSGAKIRTALNLLSPGLDVIEAKFGPVVASGMSEFTRGMNLVRSSFSTKFNEAGRIPDTMLAMMEKTKNTSSAQSAAVANSINNIYDKLGVTKDEDKALSWMLAHDKPPAAGDGRYETIYNLLVTPNGQQTALDIANGKYGDDTQRIWQAAQEIRDLNKRNLLAMRESGMAVYKQDNHISNMLNEPKGVLRPFRGFQSSTAFNAERSEVSKFRNVKDPSDIKYGNENALNFKKLSVAEERTRVTSQLEEEVVKNTERTADIKSEISELWDKVTARMRQDIIEPNKGLLKQIAGEKKGNYEALVKAVSDAIPALDRERILKTHIEKATAAAGEALKGKKITAEDVIKLKKELATGDEDLDTIAQSVIDKAAEFKVTLAPAKKTAEGTVKAEKSDYEEAVKKLMQTVTDNGINAKKNFLDEAFAKPITDEAGAKTFKDVIANLSDEWTKSPEGVQRLLNSISLRSEKLQELMELLDNTKKSLSQELSSPGLKQIDGQYFYKSNSGEIYERERASAAAINQILHNGNPVYVESASKQLLNSALNVIRTTSAKHMLDDVGKHFGVKEFAAPSNYVRVGLKDLSEGAKDLTDFIAQRAKSQYASYEGESLFYHPTVALALHDMLKVMEKDPASSFWLKGFDNITNMWKASVTSIFPMFHGRNALSNVFQNFMNLGYEAANPHTHMLASRMIWHNGELERLATDAAAATDPEAFKKLMNLYDTPVMTDKRGYTWTVGELNDQIRNNVIAFNPSIMGQMDTQRSPKAMLTEVEDHLFPSEQKVVRGGKAIKSAVTYPFQKGRKVGQVLENQARLVNFLTNLRETGDIEHSTQMVKQFLFDYQNLTSFERSFMRRIIPFYTFSRKNFELMASSLLTNPGRIAAFGHGVQNVGDVFSGGGLSDEERAMLPHWMRDGLNIVIQRKGDKVKMISSLGTPFEQPFQAMTNLFGSINPLIKLPIESQTGYSFFYGKPLSDVTNADAYASPLVPGALKDFIGFTTVTYKTKDGVEHTRNVALDPRAMNLISNLPLIPRVLTTLKTWDSAPPVDANGVTQNLFGVKASDIDLTNEKKQREKEMQQQLEQILTDAGVGYKFERFQLKK